jgi:hypothetical protein
MRGGKRRREVIIYLPQVLKGRVMEERGKMGEKENEEKEQRLRKEIGTSVEAEYTFGFAVGRYSGECKI